MTVLKAIQEDFTKRQVWTKAQPIINPNWGLGAPQYLLDPAEWRYDAYTTIIKWSDYGDRQSPYGWDIDHILARALGGGDHISNLRPLHFSNNASLGGGLSTARGLGGLGIGRGGIRGL